MPETREKVYRSEDERARDEADAIAHGWSVVRDEPLPSGAVRVLYEHPDRSQWATPGADEGEPDGASPGAKRRRPLVGCALLVVVALLLVGYVFQNNLTRSVPEVPPAPSPTAAA